MARPTDYTPELVAEICELVAQGKSIRQIAELDEMPAMSTVFKWLSEHSEFSEQYAHAKEVAAELFADEMMDIADMTNAQDVQVAKLRIDTRKWVASKLKPKKYGDKQTVEHGGVDGKPIPLEIVVSGIKSDKD